MLAWKLEFTGNAHRSIPTVFEHFDVTFGTHGLTYASASANQIGLSTPICGLLNPLTLQPDPTGLSKVFGPTPVIGMPRSCTVIRFLCCELASSLLVCRPLQRQDHGECRALAHGAGDIDAAVVVFDDAAGQREAEAGAVALGGVERAEDVG